MKNLLNGWKYGRRRRKKRFLPVFMIFSAQFYDEN